MDYSVPHYIKTLEAFEMDGIRYQVCDHIYARENCRVRTLGFLSRDLSESYIHSAVHLDEGRPEEPSYETVQRLLRLWSGCAPLDSVLVMGCAGCAVPRFLARNFPDCKTTGLEYSPKMIEIAEKFFFLPAFEGRFRLLQEDAFRYFSGRGKTEKYRVIYVDLYNAQHIPEEVFTAGFIAELREHLTPDGLVLVNLLDCPRKAALRFGRLFTGSYDRVLLIDEEDHVCLTAAVGGEKTTAAFRSGLEKIKKFVDITE